MLHSFPSRLALLFVVPMLAGNLAAQSQVTITATKDNTLYEDANGSLSNGAGSRCFVGITVQQPPLRRRALMAFSLAGQIPPFSTITKVELVITVETTNAKGARTMNLHRVTADWGEGTSVAGGGSGPGSGGGAGASSTTNDATWLHTFFSTKNWTNAGGDFNATASGSTSVNGNGSYTFASANGMVADVQGWLDKPATNFGWLLDSTVYAWAIATRENSTATSRPRLVVSYTPPAATVSSMGTGCSGSGTTALTLAANGKPTVPNASFSLGMTGGPAGTGLIALGFGSFPNGIPLGGGCSLYVDPSPILLVLGVPANRILPLPIPNQATLLGFETIWQGAVGDAVTTFLTTSNGLTVRFGL